MTLSNDQVGKIAGKTSAMTKTALHLTDEDLTRYRATARRREARERQEMQHRLEQARTVARQAADRLKNEFEASRVILFGSLARGQFFHRCSDIDLAVEGIDDKLFWRAWSALDAITSEFEIELVSVEAASPRLRQELKREGNEL